MLQFIFSPQIIKFKSSISICYSIFLFFAFNLFFHQTIFAQPTISLSKTIGTNGSESIHDLIADHDGHIIALGQCDSVDRDTSLHYHGGSSDIWLVKMDAAGNILWQKTYGGSNEDKAYQIIQTADNCFLFCGISYSSDGDIAVYNGSFITWIVKIDSNGNILWQQGLYGGEPYHLMQLQNGKYLIACYTVNITDDFPVHYGGGFTEDAWIVFISDSGVIDTALHYGGSSDDIITEVIEMPNKDLQMFGYTSSTDYDLTGTTAFGNWDGWILRTDSNGIIKWVKRWGGGAADEIIGAVMLPDKGFLAAGTSVSNDTDVWVMKLDSMGNVLSNYFYGGGSIDAMYGRLRIYEAKSNVFVFGALTYSSNGDVEFNHGLSDFWVVSVDSNGILITSKTAGGSSDDYPLTNSIYNNNAVLEAGLTGSNDFDVQEYHGAGDGLLIKMEGLTLAGDIEDKNNRVKIFPNPLHEQFTVASSNGDTFQNTWLSIYDSDGKILLTKKIHQRNETIFVSGLKAGSYYYVIKDRHQNTITSGKLIIQ